MRQNLIEFPERFGGLATTGFSNSIQMNAYNLLGLHNELHRRSAQLRSRSAQLRQKLMCRIGFCEISCRKADVD